MWFINLKFNWHLEFNWDLEFNHQPVTGQPLKLKYIIVPLFSLGQVLLYKSRQGLH